MIINMNNYYSPFVIGYVKQRRGFLEPDHSPSENGKIVIRRKYTTHMPIASNGCDIPKGKNETNGI